jgi:O-antigen ligase
VTGVPRSAIAGLALAAAALLFAPLFGATLEQTAPLVLAAVCAGSAFFAVISRLPPEHPMRTPQSLAVGVGIAAAFLSIFVSVNKGASLEAFVLAAGLAALWFSLSRLSHESALRWIVGTVVLAASAVALWGIREYLSTWAAYGEPGTTWRIFARFANPNSLAGYLALTAPLTLGALMTARAKATLWLASVGLWAQLGALALTGSRFGTASGLAALALFALGYAAVYRTTHRRFGRAVVVAVVGVAVFAACTGPLLRRETAAQTATQTAAVQVTESQAGRERGGGLLSKVRDPFREHVWASAARIWLAHPILGTGVGTFEYIYPAYATVGYTGAAHEGYLQALSEMGSLWIVVFALWIAALAQGGVRALRAGGDSGALRIAALAGVAGSAIHSLYDYDWQVWAIPATMCAVIIIALGPGEGRTSPPDAGRHPRARLRFVSLLATGILAAMAMVLAASGRLASTAESGSLSNEQRIAKYREAIRLDPLDGELKRNLGALLVELSWQEDDPALADQGIALMRKGCSQTPTDAVGWYRLGRALDDLQRTGEAVKSLEKAVENSRIGTPALAALADIYLYSDDLDKARDLFGRVVEIQNGPVGRYPAVAGSVNPDCIAAEVGLGEIALLEGDYDTSAVRNIEGLKVFREHQVWMQGLGGGLLAVRPGSQEELDAYLSASHAASSLATIYDEKAQGHKAEVWSDCTDILTAFAEGEDAALKGDSTSAQRELRDVAALAESTPLSEPLARSIACRAAARALQKLAADAAPAERADILEESRRFERQATEAEALIQ